MNPATVLVVDDEATMRRAMAEALKRFGFAVETARDGQEAAERLSQGPMSLLITDVKMPRITGMDLLDRAKGLYPEMPVLVVTGYGTIPGAVEAMKKGAADYIVKPFSAEDLEQTVKRLLAEQVEQPSCGRDQEDGGETRLISVSQAFIKIIKIATNVASTDATVLIEGESGTGKELVACHIHASSRRKTGPFVAVNCAALPETLLESELFGHERGAFTGALERRIGKFELAHQGTLLLDEIGEMPMSLQSKLLRVLQQREVDRLGGKVPVPVDIRVIATTNTDLSKAVGQGKFREDLYYRINVINLKLLPLRERPEDIKPLIEHFAKVYARRYEKKIKEVDPKTVELLMRYDWPGNVRQLQNTIERTVLLTESEVIEPGCLFLDNEPAKSPAAGKDSQAQTMSLAAGMSIKEMETRLILLTLEECGGNRTKAASKLGISIRTLRNKLRELRQEGIAVPGDASRQEPDEDSNGNNCPRVGQDADGQGKNDARRGDAAV